MAGKRRKKTSDVIDVGEAPPKGTEESSEESESEEPNDGDADAVDEVLASAVAPVEAEDDDGHVPDEILDEPPPEVRSKGGSLARRDPLGAYMAETRRYPLLTPEEEHD